MSPASKKRKLADGVPTYYGVRAGHTPGVYTEWKECQENITGFKGASFKKFPSEEEAQDFVDGKPTASTSAKNGEPKFYGVAVGHKPGVYTEWTEAQKQIQNVKGPKYKKFATKKEAEEFVKSGVKSTKKNLTEKVEVDLDDMGEPAAKKTRTRSSTSSASAKNGAVMKVWTDGSSRGNGKKGAIAGVGVYFSNNDPRNVSEPLQGNPQTNNRAELTAVIRALQICPQDQSMEIISDSNYSINCATVWYRSWSKNGWKTSTRQPVENKDLVVLIRSLIEGREEKGVKTTFKWIKGHSTDEGNVAADRLAVAGAMASR